MNGIIPPLHGVSAFASNEDPILGNGPIFYWGNTAPDGDAAPWAQSQIGSEYTQVGTTGTVRKWMKVKNDGADDDWRTTSGVIRQKVLYSQFTDGGSTVGTKTLTEQIPVGAWVRQTLLHNVTGFTGNTSAVLTVGDGTDVDRYNTGTPSVFTTAVAIDMGVPSGTKIHVTAATVTLTVTSATDFTSVSAGALTISIFYDL